MFNKKAKRIKELEEKLVLLEEKLSELQNERAINENEKEFKNIPKLPQKYYCDNCRMVSFKKMKEFKKKEDGFWRRIILCNDCLNK